MSNRPHTKATKATDQVAVIGAGFAGLSAACHLRRLGHDVVVIEANDEVGGRAGSLHHGDMRFDTGPTVITMPELIDETFAAVDAETKEFCELVRLDPAYLAHFHDGSSLRIGSTVEETAKQIGSTIGGSSVTEFHQFVDWVGKMYDTAYPTFVDNEIDRPSALLASLPQFVKVIRQGGFNRWDSHVQRIFSDERLRRMFSFQALYAGVSPLDALGVFAIIAHMDTVAGVYTAIGGANGVAVGFAEAAGKAGVQIRCSERVTGLRPLSGGGVEITTDQDSLRAAAAVVTVDLPLAYDDVLATRRPRSVRRGTPSPSCIVWHVASQGPVTHEIGHLNVYFDSSWDQSLKQLFKERKTLDQPSRFITAPAVSDPTSWNGSGQPLSILEPVPDLTADIDWRQKTPELTERTMGWLSEQGFSVEAEPVAIVDPPEWRNQGAAFGTPFSLSHTFLQSGPFRPRPTDRRLPGVVFAGSGTHPGVGVPMVVLSGKFAAQKVDRMLGKGSK